jgi:hypothetical protein
MDRLNHISNALGILFIGPSPRVYVLSQADRGELLAAAEYDWQDVEPAIFGTLLEQALTSNQRAQLGAHYTPRPYVERLVETTITDVLRPKWEELEHTLEGLETAERLERLRAFHDQLTNVRVLDPACGTGNFLYVAMEALLGLENKVIQAIEDLGAEAHSRVGPGQFHGLEKNPRAAKIAELVLWIGWLRWNMRNGAGSVQEPILGQRANINFGRPGGYDAVLAQDEATQPILDNPHQPEWPDADFIVGNPPFIGGKGSGIRSALGSEYAEALWKANPNVGASADFVMQWWDRAAVNLAAPNTRLKRFGFVTTNSITQAFSRRVLERHLAQDVHLVLACPDHPWTKASPDAAAVRIAMTVAEAGPGEGRLLEIQHEAALDTDEPDLRFAETHGLINADLTVGADATTALPLKANEGLSCNGMMLAGQGFKVDHRTAKLLIAQDGEQARSVIRPYLGGAELLQGSRGNYVIDFFGLSEIEARQRYPRAYQHVLQTVKPERDQNRRAAMRERWWLFGEVRRTFRPALEGLSRYIATTETAKHRVFQFVSPEVVPDHMIIAIASDDTFHLGVLSSRIHVQWARRAGGTLEDRPRYTKASIFDPFPFPNVTPEQRKVIGNLAEELNTTRLEALAEVPRLTITEIYNWRERIAADEQFEGANLDRATAARAFIVHRLHEQIDEAVAKAYGWSADLAPAEIVARLVALNAERKAEEELGKIRWLRPEYQQSKFGRQEAAE